jgi:F-type H+-transporting ATPase subunit epsilon
MKASLMTLNVFLPSGIFASKKDISCVVAESTIGSFGLLPNRLDCIAALVPGILAYESKSEGEKFVAIDEGVLIKTGPKILISVRNAVAGRNLDQLHKAVVHEFMNFNAQEKSARQVMAKMESSFIQRLAEMRNE